MIVGGLVTAAYGAIGLWSLLIGFIGMVIPLVNTKHSKNVGITLIVFAIIGNLVLLIPGIMAYRWKPESQSGIRPESEEERARVKGIADGEMEKDEEELREEQRLKDEIKRLEDKKKQLEEEKGD